MDKVGNVLDLGVILADRDVDWGWGVALELRHGGKGSGLDGGSSAESRGVLKSANCGGSRYAEGLAEGGGGGSTQGTVDGRHSQGSSTRIVYRYKSIEVVS